MLHYITSMKSIKEQIVSANLLFYCLFLFCKLWLGFGLDIEIRLQVGIDVKVRVWVRFRVGVRARIAIFFLHTVT